MQQANVVFIVEMTEYERGWGQRPDGFLAFGTEDAAKAYVQEETKGRTGPAPEIYVAYSMLGYRACSPAVLARVLTASEDANGQCVYIDKLAELQG